ncbi:MAG TPA: hypothetical protein VK922_07540 [Gemmatimonadaceae bacterium]|nr:hypothetical protein [Gemmatimonadaceae bacterium]
MPRDKDLKRLVRARMTKTGESYTSARAVLVARTSPTPPPSATPRSEWPTLAGMSDTALRAKTGRTWADWVKVLDEARAFEMSHRDIARHLVHEHDVPGWWSQMVAVGYERIRGLRDVNQRRDGAYEANKSRTFAVALPTLFEWFHDTRRRKRWLPDGPVKLRSSVPGKSLRFDWSDGTRVHVFFTAKGAGKTSVAVQHAKLAAKDDIAKAKAFWEQRFDALGAYAPPRSSSRANA